MKAIHLPPSGREPLKIYGSQTFRAGMEASSVEVLGHLHVRGKLTADRMKLRGSARSQRPAAPGSSTASAVCAPAAFRPGRLQPADIYQ